MYGATSELQALPRESMPALSLAIVGVECDDISNQTSAPKSILDAKGHSVQTEGRAKCTHDIGGSG